MHHLTFIILGSINIHVKWAVSLAIANNNYVPQGFVWVCIVLDSVGCVACDHFGLFTFFKFLSGN